MKLLCGGFILGAALVWVLTYFIKPLLDKPFAPVIQIEVDDEFNVTKLSSLIFHEGEWIPHGEVYNIDIENNDVEYFYYRLGVIEFSEMITYTAGIKNASLAMVFSSLESREAFFGSNKASK